MSKESILNAIRKVKPEKVELPEIPDFHRESSGTLADFIKTVEGVGSKVVLEKELKDINQAVQNLFPAATIIASPLEKVQSTIDLKKIQSPHELEKVDVAVLKAQLGVAENGALWLSEQDLGIRVLPFITQHLIILLDSTTLVNTMHEAYQKIRIDEAGFGLFIAGPSKTADIEQSLVIGAQGARSLTIFIKPSESN